MQARSYKAVVTSALSQADSAPFVDAGFAVRERLHLLAHDLDQLPPPTGSARRARRHDHSAILDLGATAFDGDWRLDHDRLVGAARATPVATLSCRTWRERADHRVRRDRPVRTQRVPPTHRRPRRRRRRGFARTLIADALWWLRRRAVDRALVNTQLDNTAALSLYESCGFRRLPVGLCVLGRTL